MSSISIHIIIGIVLLLVELDILFGLRYKEFHHTYRFPVKIWHILLLIVGNLPIVCYVTFMIFTVGLFFDLGCYHDLYLNKGVMKKVLDGLNKKLVDDE